LRREAAGPSASSAGRDNRADSSVADNSMAHDLRNTCLVQTLTDLFADLADLLRKELQLAKMEITEKIASRLRAGVWMVVAGALGMVAVLLLVEAAVFAIASLGLALHWRC